MSVPSNRRKTPANRRLFFETLEERRVMAVDAALVKDINTTNVVISSDPQNLTNVNGTLFFTATSRPRETVHDPLRNQDTELWKSDGTTAGTVKVKDIAAGVAGSYPTMLTNVNGTLFFEAYQPGNLAQLWKSDGTAAGTVKIMDFPYGSAGSPAMSNLTAVDDQLFFSVNGLSYGQELWKSDGTAAGTRLVADIYSGATGSFPTQLTNIGGTLFFAAKTSSEGVELWKSDGTAAGTKLLSDINPGASNSNPQQLTNVSGELYFAADDGSTGLELWKSDGTTLGTQLVKDIQSTGSSRPNNLTNFNGTLVFGASYQLWKSDGTTAGTQLVKARIDNGPDRVDSLRVVGNQLFFSGRDTSSHTELWKSDGTSSGTLIVKKVNAGQGSSYPQNLTNVNGVLYFTAVDVIHSGHSLWKTDGTEAGTVFVDGLTKSPVDPDPRKLTNVNGTLFFTRNDAAYGLELWKSNGTTTGTVIVKDIAVRNEGSGPSNLTNVGGLVYFTAFDPASGSTQLWKSNGAASGTAVVKNLNLIAQTGYLSNLTEFQGSLYFTADNGTNGKELWKSDGTAAGTTLLKDIRAGGSSSNPHNFINVGGVLYFVASDGLTGYELWKTDGTAAGTVLVQDIKPDVAGSNPQKLTNVAGTLFFLADDGTHGSELWKTNSTGGASLVKDITPGTAGSIVNQLAVVNQTLYFTVKKGTNDSLLWKSDGTIAGTIQLIDVHPGAGAGGIPSMVDYKGVLYFAVTDSFDQRDTALWQSNGTSAGTKLVKTLATGSQEVSRMVVAGGSLYFVLGNIGGGDGRGLWKSNGTSAGTVLLKPNVNCVPIMEYAGQLLFTYATGIGITNGTLGGTKAISGIEDNGVSNPQFLTQVGDSLYFSGKSNVLGTELYRLQNVISTATTIAKNAEGAIEIKDLVGKSNSILFYRYDNNLVIVDQDRNDPYGVISVSGIAGVLGNNTNYVTIPLSAVQATGKPLVFNLGDGNDVVQLAMRRSFVNPIPTGLTLNAGTGGGSFYLRDDITNNVWTITGPDSGTLKLGTLGTVNFSGFSELGGGEKNDLFVIANTGINRITHLDGATIGGNTIQVARDMNATLTDRTLNIQSLKPGDPIQTFILNDIDKGILTGGPGNNFFDANTFSGSVNLNGLNGNDVLWGGAGNDFIDGGAGNNFVGGGPGDDTLLASGGRNIFVGGIGADSITGGTNDDLLIGGRTTYGFQKPFVDAILAAWDSADTYANRIKQLSVTGVGTNKQFKLNATTVLDDNAIDSLLGGSGLDWFFVGTSGLFKDTHDAVTGEQVVGV